MSRTIDEIMNILGNNYTPEELVDILEISSNELCQEFEESILVKMDDLNKMIGDDIGETDDEDY